VGTVDGNDKNEQCNGNAPDLLVEGMLDAELSVQQLWRDWQVDELNRCDSRGDTVKKDSST